MASYKPQFLIDGEWCDNAVRFATREDAERNARAKFQSWSVPSDYRAAASDDAPNYRYTDGRLEGAPAGAGVSP